MYIFLTCALLILFRMTPEMSPHLPMPIQIPFTPMKMLVMPEGIPVTYPQFLSTETPPRLTALIQLNQGTSLSTQVERLVIKKLIKLYKF